jgi:hypothetical protein
MAPLIPALRWEVLTALAKARENVARGSPSVALALRYQRLTEKGRIEADKAIDDVRFEVPGGELLATALQQPEGAARQELDDALRTAEANRSLIWEDGQGLTRAQAVALLHLAHAFAASLPVTSAGPLLPSLPLTRSQS